MIVPSRLPELIMYEFHANDPILAEWPSMTRNLLNDFHLFAIEISLLNMSFVNN